MFCPPVRLATIDVVKPRRTSWRRRSDDNHLVIFPPAAADPDYRRVFPVLITEPVVIRRILTPHRDIATASLSLAQYLATLTTLHCIVL